MLVLSLCGHNCTVMKNRLAGSGTRAYRFNSKLHKDQMPIKARPFMVPSKIVTLLAYCAPFHRWDVRQYNMWISASRERGGINEPAPHSLIRHREEDKGFFQELGQSTITIFYHHHRSLVLLHLFDYYTLLILYSVDEGSHIVGCWRTLSLAITDDTPRCHSERTRRIQVVQLSLFISSNYLIKI